jgi:hypothetical protein
MLEMTWKTWIPKILVFTREKKLILIKQALNQWVGLFFNPSDKERKYLKEKLDLLQK